MAWLIVGATFVLGAVLIWPAAQNLLEMLINNGRADRFWLSLLVIYYASWLAGPYVDILIHRRAGYNLNSRDGDRILWIGYTSGVFLILAALILFFSIGNAPYFAIGLDILFLTDVVSWKKARPFTRRIIEASKATFASEQERISRLTVANDYMTGRWHIFRFLVIFIILFILNLTSFVPAFQTMAAHILAGAIRNATADRIIQWLPVLEFLTLIVCAEMWRWSKRFVFVSATSSSMPPESLTSVQLKEYINQFFDWQLKGVNYLLVAHAVALVTVITSMKEQFATVENNGSSAATKTSLVLRAIGEGHFISIFSSGLICAILGFVMLLVARDRTMNAIFTNGATGLNNPYHYFVSLFCVISTILLLAGIIKVVFVF